MSMKFQLYPTVKVTGKSFKNVKRVVVPNQSMTLREILQRYVRREPLPVAREGTYEERFGDIEKISKADIVEQMERIDELKSQIDSFEKRMKEHQEKVKADRKKAEEAAAAAQKEKEPTPDKGKPDQKSPL